MASSARAYAPNRRLDAPVAPKIAPKISVHQGQNKEAASKHHLATLFKIGIAVAFVVCAMAVARIWLIDASMDMLTQATAVKSQIEDAKTVGSSLEVQYFAKTNPGEIKAYASQKLAMVPASDVPERIDLTPESIKTSVAKVSEAATSYKTVKDTFGQLRAIVETKLEQLSAKYVAGQ